ncbi:IS481 family transposase [Curtobacterium sp. VKM Ac-1393]|uniref:IS481 family transposase n=1 Tax=Curtobacterium sp. VKM Ac-1393 TaxID=2783814 RepID=UPI00188B3D5D|nr:IS481 family transposase [Curtobacterium sp. VKM Ac-1393]MBF4609597.1 IS481 family transposase [Curtobacterium sp. VKM Ac-1393]
MSHANARLTLHGRRLLVARVIEDHRPVAHVAKELGVSRQCAHRWVRRFRAEGAAGLLDRSSRPLRTPTKTSPEREAAVLAARAELRFGPARLAAYTGVPERTISRILRRHQVPPLAWLDPITGALIRATRSTMNRYEHERPGDMVHVDVKKLGRIPDGGGWRVHGRGVNARDRRNPIGFDYVHAAVDDHSRLAYAEIHPDEKGATVAGFLTRAAAYFADHGVTRIERVISDNAFAYRHSAAFKDAVSALGARQKFIKPHCPWQNGKVERFNRTLATEWAYRQPFTSNQARADALAPWIEHYNNDRIHSSHGLTPAARVSPTS